MLRTNTLRAAALGAALILPLLAGGCSSMMGGGGNDTGSASTVSRDSQGAGAISGAVAPQGDTTQGVPGRKNPPSN